MAFRDAAPPQSCASRRVALSDLHVADNLAEQSSSAPLSAAAIPATNKSKLTNADNLEKPSSSTPLSVAAGLATKKPTPMSSAPLSDVGAADGLQSGPLVPESDDISESELAQIGSQMQDIVFEEVNFLDQMFESILSLTLKQSIVSHS